MTYYQVTETGNLLNPGWRELGPDELLFESDVVTVQGSCWHMSTFNICYSAENTPRKRRDRQDNQTLRYWRRLAAKPNDPSQELT